MRINNTDFTKVVTLTLIGIKNKEHVYEDEKESLRNYIKNTKSGFQRELFNKGSFLPPKERAEAISMLSNYSGSLNPYWFEKSVETYFCEELGLPKREINPICSYFMQMAEEFIEKDNLNSVRDADFAEIER